MGKILQIDLTTETAKEYPFTDQQRRETLGGKALAYHAQNHLPWLFGKARSNSGKYIRKQIRSTP